MVAKYHTEWRKPQKEADEKVTWRKNMRVRRRESIIS